MNAMIEKIARALCKVRGEDPDREFIDRHGKAQGYPWWRSLVDDARAAIEAMREPTEAMLDAGSEADILAWSLEPGEGLDGIDIGPAWSAMITAALTPDEPSQ